MLKHLTSSVYVFAKIKGEWKIALVHHKLFGKWMAPGGHVDEGENPAEAAVREVFEETGLRVKLEGRVAPIAEGARVVAPEFISEYVIPKEGDSGRRPEHKHVDCLYLAIAESTELAHNAAETHALGWFAESELDKLEMFPSGRTISKLFFERLKSGRS